jgi:amino acid transporter
MAVFWRRAAVVGAGVAAAVLGGASPARADNCGSLADCFFTIAGALLVAAALALLLAFIIGSGGTGLFALAGAGTLGGGAAVATALANAAAAAAAAAAASAAAGTIVQMSSSGTPGNNQAQNKQFRDAVREAERRLGRKLDKGQIRRVHDEITGQDMGYHDIVETIISMFGG